MEIKVYNFNENKHNTGTNEYYYISLIAVLPQVQRNGIGIDLLRKTFLIV